jgi:general nucleoside transport system permease protein
VSGDVGGQTGMNLDPSALTGGGRREQVATTAIAIFLGLLLGGVLMVFARFMQTNEVDLGLPFLAYGALLDGSLRDLRAIGGTLNMATPLILAGMSVAFGFRAGLFNIGANGQFLVGAFCAAVVGAMPLGIGPLHLPVAILAGFLGGAFWGFIPGLLKAWRGAHEVVTTIMLNFVAYLMLNLLASTVFADPGATFPKTRDVLVDARLPVIIEGTRLHAGFLLALGTAVAVWFLLFKTTLGFEIRTVGINAFAARYAGIRASLIAVLTMSTAGGLAGLGGASENLGVTRSYPAEYIVTFGFDGIAVALLGRAHPFGVVGAALLFATLRSGAGSMQRAAGIPIDIITIVQAFIILFVAAEAMIRRGIPWLRQRRARPSAAAA